VAVVTVDYSGHITLLLNQMTLLTNDNIISMAHAILSGKSSTGELSNNIRFLRRSIGISDIRIAFADITVEKEILANQRNNFIIIGIVSFLALLTLSVLFSKWMAHPIKKAMTAQKHFIADASHELKTPLTIILSNSHMLKESDLVLEKNSQARLNNIIAESEQMKILIEDMLQIARLDSALLPSAHENIDLSAICMSCIFNFEPYAFDKGFELVSSIEENIYIQGNAVKLKQLIDILIDNALKYSQKHSAITVILKRTSRRNALLSVENVGNPIPKAEFDKIFQRFYRIDKSREQTAGYGLGLSIAKMIAEEQKAQIWVEAGQNESNIFLVKFTTI
jgi:signal transduction histidine kinase